MIVLGIQRLEPTPSGCGGSVVSWAAAWAQKGRLRASFGSKKKIRQNVVQPLYRQLDRVPLIGIEGNAKLSSDQLNKKIEKKFFRASWLKKIPFAALIENAKNNRGQRLGRAGAVRIPQKNQITSEPPAHICAVVL